MTLRVQKFGGTSVGTPAKLLKVAKSIARFHELGNQVVVVVSAMGHTTDELVNLAQKVSPAPHRREMDMLLSTGERISMALLSMALWDLGVPAVSFTGSQSGIITDDSHRRARILRILGQRIAGSLGEGKVVIVAGFQGVSEAKEITTLGRGGSDTTAVALAAVLGADCCEILTDVQGVYSANPRVVKDAILLKHVPHDIMVEMATRGAGVLHPRSVELAKQFNVPLWVRDSSGKGEGTAVVSRQVYDGLPGKDLVKEDLNQVSSSASLEKRARSMEEFGVSAVTSDASKFLIRVKLARASALKAVWEHAAQAHLGVLAPFFSGVDLQFFSDLEFQSDWSKHLNTLVELGAVSEFSFELETIPLSVLGDRFAQDGAALHQVLEVLEKHHIEIVSGSCSPLALTVGVSKESADTGVRALHQAFIARVS